MKPKVRVEKLCKNDVQKRVGKIKDLQPDAPHACQTPRIQFNLSGLCYDNPIYAYGL